MALPKRFLKHLAEVQRCHLKPLAEHLLANTELGSHCKLHTHDKKPYIYVNLHKLMADREDITFYRFTTLLKMYLMYMSDKVEMCLEGYEFRQCIYIEDGHYKTSSQHADVPA